jgi:hypothetical protein
MTVALERTALVRWRADPIVFIEEVLHDPETRKPFVLLPAERAFLLHAFQLNDRGRLLCPEQVYPCPKKSGETSPSFWHGTAQLAGLIDKAADYRLKSGKRAFARGTMAEAELRKGLDLFSSFNHLSTMLRHASACRTREASPEDCFGLFAAMRCESICCQQRPRP